MMKYRIFLTAASLCFVQLWAFAQNIDPTVVVSREYEGKLMEVHKPVMDMEVPDSVLKFDMEFDYSVFDNPYKGSYEFKPYLLDMHPSAYEDDTRRLYLSAGAGYQFHPELDLVWTPWKNKAFMLDVYASHRSYFGTYHPLMPGQTEAWKGNDMKSLAGVDGAFNWKSGVLDFDLGYYGIAQDDFRRKRGYNAFNASFGYANKSVKDDYFLFDIKGGFGFAADKADFRSGTQSYLSESVVSMDVSMGPVFSRTHKLIVDLDVEMAAYNGHLNATAAMFSLVPHYEFKKNRWNLDLGLNISACVRPDPSGKNFSESGQYVYPAVSVEYEALRNALFLYAVADGGNNLGTYSSMIRNNRYFDMSYAGPDAQLLDNSVKRVDFALGFKGRVAEGLSYDVKGGYRDYGSAALDAVYADVPGVAYCPLRSLYAGVDVIWKSESLCASADVTYDNFIGFNMSSPAIIPAALSGMVSVEYNWMKRIIAGVDCSFASSRNGGLYGIPAFADLGLDFEYVFAGNFSAWAKVGNLLGMKIQKTPFYAEKGVYFTLGFCLNLR